MFFLRTFSHFLNNISLFAKMMALFFMLFPYQNAQNDASTMCKEQVNGCSVNSSKDIYSEGRNNLIPRDNYR